MKQTINILLTGALLSNLFTAASANDEHQRVLQRQHNLKDKTPLTKGETESLKAMLKRGTFEVVRPSTGAKQKERGLKGKESKRGGHQRNGATPRNPRSKGRGADKSAKQQTRGTPKQTQTRGAPKQTQTRGAPPTQTRAGAGSASQTRTGGGSTQRTAPNPPSQTQRQYLDDYAIGDDTSYYDDYFVRHDDYVYQDDYYTGNGGNDDHYPVDDYYYGGKGKGKGKRKGKGKGKGGSKGGDYYDDAIHYDDSIDDLIDDFFLDDSIFGGPPGFVGMNMTGFQDSRMVQTPIEVNPLSPDEFQPGTVYLYNEEDILGLLVDAGTADGSTVDENFQIGSVTGKCIRTEVISVDYVGRAYCQFTYSFLNEFGSEEAQLTAEGTVEMGTINTLAVTGGTGIFRRSVGEILLTPVDVGTGSAFSLTENLMLDLPASYYMEAFVWMEEALIPFEILA